MGNIDKYFGGISYNNGYDWHDKDKNVVTSIKYMLNRSLAMFRYVGLPETIEQRDLELILQTGGYGAWCKVNNDLYVLTGGLGGEGDAYGKPTNITVANSYLKYNKTLEIDTDCVIMQNDSMSLGLLPMYERYCTMLNESDITIILATINKRIQMLLSANDDNTVQSAKQFLNDIEAGKLGVIAESKLFDSLKVNSTASTNNVNLTDLFEMHQYLKASMYNEIGLGASNNMKKERLIVAEVETNSDCLYPLVDDMLTCRRKALEKINEMFGTDIQVEFNSTWDDRVNNGEPINTIQDGENNEEISNTNVEPAEEQQNTTIEQTVEPTDEPKEEPTVEATTETVSDDTGEVSTELEEKDGETHEHDETSETRGTDEQSDEATEVSEDEPTEQTDEPADDNETVSEERGSEVDTQLTDEEDQEDEERKKKHE